MKQINLNPLILGITLFCGFTKNHHSVTYTEINVNDVTHPYLIQEINEKIKNRHGNLYSWNIFRTVIDENNNIIFQYTYLKNIHSLAILSNVNIPNGFYRKTSYYDLSGFEKKLFDYYGFNQNQTVIIMGLLKDFLNPPFNRADTMLFIHGKMYVDGECRVIKWDHKEFCLFDKKDPSSKIASINIDFENQKITHNFLK